MVANTLPRCLVLGGRGFIGSHLVDRLLDFGYPVRCFGRPQTLGIQGFHPSNPNFEFFEGDFISQTNIQDAMRNCKICFHLISTTLPKSSNQDPIFDVESNLVGSLNILSQAAKLGVQKVIFISSGGTVYGTPQTVPIPETHANDPTCSYGITKLAIEKYLALFHQLHGLDYRILRLANPYGERQRQLSSQGAIAVFLGKVLRNEPIEIWGDGSIVRDYIHISDVVSALIAVLDYTGEQRVFNIGSGRGLTLNEILDSIEEVVGKQAQRRYLKERPFDVKKSILCIERAQVELNWSPEVSLHEGLTKFAEWVQAQRD